ncbi:PREDICTED: phosphoribosyl pyrophosphate synthase-associated protein 2-like [Amphimedon queenslandica]|uniref:Ribose-phosphate pyrophosphokinase N-terminal domain-containing protein n=1 Tax=Amphimedon queenslandica TaxID=400682 RepID=A0A1X7VT65_AMPQE|nr:PREDICTED: phosphoribosyl pyrophosphate synthase-associated protein 2-like [Amphimedon queenslandica]XP_019853837.1 PREDICTED: phosphoribosyl pyrophosphate synthase-associated protein 2-like [Amphimedon queenslandica]|eukprot:XP_019853834.1 PREDICTED: phosphoribosyl pyrophosphate synthase-associated protein 2-like [Amphimedon queenslandica]
MAVSWTGNKLPHGTMSTPYAKGMIVISGSSCKELAASVTRRMDVPLSPTDIKKDSSNETHVDINVSVRGKDVFIIQTGHGNLSCNDLLMELFILTYACRTSSARKIIGVIPYLPYSTHCIMRRRGCVTAKLLASMMAKSGLSHLVTMDLYHKEIQGFFDFPVDNLRCSQFLIQYITSHIPDYKNGVVVARYPGVTLRATSFAERLRLSLAVIHGEVKDPHDGRNSPPPDDHTPRRIQVARKEKPPLNIVGDVEGHNAFIIDDVIDEVDSLIAAAQCIKKSGAKKIFVVATHAPLSGDSPKKLQESCIDQAIVTNTIPQEENSKICTKLQTIDISVMLSEAIRRIYHGESMSYLFKNVPLED